MLYSLAEAVDWATMARVDEVTVQESVNSQLRSDIQVFPGIMSNNTASVLSFCLFIYLVYHYVLCV